MGLQVDLTKLLGISNRIECPKCKKLSNGHLNDYDLESPSINPKPGLWVLMFYCPKCDHEWTERYQITLTKLN